MTRDSNMTREQYDKRQQYAKIQTTQKGRLKEEEESQSGSLNGYQAKARPQPSRTKKTCLGFVGTASKLTCTPSLLIFPSVPAITGISDYTSLHPSHPRQHAASALAPVRTRLLPEGAKSHLGRPQRSCM